MRFATLLFHATASFFLGIVAIATGGAAVLQSIFAPKRARAWWIPRTMADNP